MREMLFSLGNEIIFIVFLYLQRKTSMCIMCVYIRTEDTVILMKIVHNTFMTKKTYDFTYIILIKSNNFSCGFI